jgi:hypothetical protein
MRARRLTLLSLSLPAMVLGTFAGAAPVLAAPCDTSGTSLGNGGFETPAVPPASNTNFLAADIPPWQTTDGAGWIEIWGDGFGGVPSYEGNAFAELNATTPGTLYQDVVSVPGSTMTWTLAHRGRLGDDSMQVLIGDANLADVNGATGWAYISPDLTDGTTAWGVHTDDYLVPAGQTCTRFAFRAVTSVGGASFGNFLDAVSFTTTIPAPPSDPPSEPAGSVAAITPPPTDASLGGSPDPTGGWLGVVLVVSIAVTTALAVAGLRRTRQRP